MGITPWPHNTVDNISLCRNVSDCKRRVVSLISAQSHAFVDINHKIFSTTILLSSADSRRVVVSYKRKYVHEVPVNRLVKLAQEKMWLGELIVRTWP